MNREDKEEEMYEECFMEIVTETEGRHSNTRMDSDDLNSPPPSKTERENCTSVEYVIHFREK